MNHQRKFRTDEERVGIIKKVSAEVAQGAATPDACKGAGITASQYYTWRSKLSGKPNGSARTIKTSDRSSERQLLVENQRLKMIVAEQALDIQALKEWQSR